MRVLPPRNVGRAPKAPPRHARGGENEITTVAGIVPGGVVRLSQIAQAWPT